MKKEYIWPVRAFLTAYLVMLAFHAREFPWNDWQVCSGFALGLGVAYASHSRTGAVTIALLLCHMGIEWSEHVRRYRTYAGTDFLFHGVHAAFDLAFLFRELRDHSRAARRIARAIALIGTGSACCGFVLRSGAHVPAYSEAIGAFVTGGMFGCVLYHLLKTVRTKKGN